MSDPNRDHGHERAHARQHEDLLGDEALLRMAAALKKIETLSSEEFIQFLVDRGVITSDGTLNLAYLSKTDNKGNALHDPCGDLPKPPEGAVMRLTEKAAKRLGKRASAYVEEHSDKSLYGRDVLVVETEKAPDGICRTLTRIYGSPATIDRGEWAYWVLPKGHFEEEVETERRWEED